MSIIGECDRHSDKQQQELYQILWVLQLRNCQYFDWTFLSLSFLWPLKLLMEVQIHPNCIPSSFYTSKPARITIAAVNHKSPSCISHGLAISKFPSASPLDQVTCIGFIIAKKNKPQRQSCKPTIAAHLHHSGSSHFKSDSAIIIGDVSFKRIYKGVWCRVITAHRSQMFVTCFL